MKTDKEILRDLAYKWIEIAKEPIMDERKRQWSAVKDLKAEKPMIFTESWEVYDSELYCNDYFYRKVECNIRSILDHYEGAGDDIVLDPYFRLPWDVSRNDFGIYVKERHALDSEGRAIGYDCDNPIKKPEDISKIMDLEYKVNKEHTLLCKDKLEDAIGDILPVVVGNYDYFADENDLGNNMYTGVNFIAISYEVVKLISDETLSYWVYDNPEAVHKITEHVTNGIIAFYEWLERENLLDYNNDGQFSGPGSYGYTSDLSKSGNKVHLKDVWARTESQESVILSPDMFNEFFLQYIAKACKHFGLVYYGCCEPLHDRFELIKKAIPNLRAVSVTPWSDQKKMAEMLGKNYVYSRKPVSSYISVANPDWDNIKKDLLETYDAAKYCNLEIIIRDMSDVKGHRNHIKKWIEMFKSVFYV